MAETIQVVSPDWGDAENASEAEAEFWAEVSADPAVVVVVMSVPDEDEEGAPSAVFSTYDLASEHAKTVPTYGALLVPMRIDEPSWGNVAVN